MGERISGTEQLVNQKNGKRQTPALSSKEKGERRVICWRRRATARVRWASPTRPTPRRPDGGFSDRPAASGRWWPRGRAGGPWRDGMGCSSSPAPPASKTHPPSEQAARQEVGKEAGDHRQHDDADRPQALLPAAARRRLVRLGQRGAARLADRFGGRGGRRIFRRRGAQRPLRSRPRLGVVGEAHSAASVWGLQRPGLRPQGGAASRRARRAGPLALPRRAGRRARPGPAGLAAAGPRRWGCSPAPRRPAASGIVGTVAGPCCRLRIRSSFFHLGVTARLNWQLSQLPSFRPIPLGIRASAPSAPGR